MSINPQPLPRTGDYVVSCGTDTPENRESAEQTLKANGCKQFWTETKEYGRFHDDRIVVHGYL